MPKYSTAPANEAKGEGAFAHCSTPQDAPNLVAHASPTSCNECARPLVSTAAKSKGSNVKVHFKNSVEVVHAIRGMSIARAKSYLENVLEHKEAIPFQRFKVISSDSALMDAG